MKFTLPLLVALAAPPVATRPDSFTRLREVDATIRQEMRYSGAHNFVGTPIDGYRKPECWLLKPAAEALARAQKQAKHQRLSLKVFDCYRPQKAVEHFVRWAKDLADQKQKAVFYPKVDKARLFQEGYIASRSGHSRGATVDLTLTDEKGAELDMGTPFDFFDPLAHTANAAVSKTAAANRKQFLGIMERAGFKNYEKEWWHYTLEPEPGPDRYFDFPVE